MKSTLLRLSALVLTFSVGITLPLFFKTQRSTESVLPVPLTEIRGVVSSGCPGGEYVVKGSEVVFSVADDSEIYFGKRKVALSEVADIVRKIFRNEFPDNHVVFIKSGANVRFETVSLIADQLKSANVTCIEFRLDKKKKGGP